MVVAAIFVSVGLVVVGAVIVGVGVHVSVSFALVVSVRVFVLVLVSIREHVRVPGSLFMRVLLAGHVSFALLSVGIFVGVISINVGVVVVDDHSVHFMSVGGCTVKVFISMVVSLVGFVRQGCGEREGQKGENNTSAKSQHFFIIQIFCLVKKREIQRERETEGETEELFKKEIVDDGNVNGR